MQRKSTAFTLTELLVSITIIAALTGLLLPSLGSARQKARSILNANNQRQSVSTVSQFALDHRDRFPQSVATIGVSDSWHWQEPMMLTGFQKRAPKLHRALSEYLRGYADDGRAFYCPHAPSVYPHLQAAWEAGDDWDNPDPLTMPLDPVIGTYCLYWNYVGYLEGGGIFRGPRSFADGRGFSRLMMCDYFGYDHWRGWETCGGSCFASCDRFAGAEVTSGTAISSPFWCSPPGKSQPLPAVPELTLYAGYTDGRVETYSTSECYLMRVSSTADGSTPYPVGSGVGPGYFFLPAEALR